MNAPGARVVTGLLLLAAASCAAPVKLITLPTVPATPAPDAPAAIDSATRDCRGVSTITAEISVTGTVDGRRVPHAHLITGIAEPASVRIEATVPLGGTAFVFTSRAGEATLLLSRDNRALEHGHPDEVLEAVTGVPLTVDGLRSTLTGCAQNPDAGRAQHLGQEWIVAPDAGGAEYFQKDKSTGAWRLVVASHGQGRDAWRAEYRDFHEGLPRAIRLASDDRSRFNLALTLSQVDLNVAIPDAAFTVNIPASASPISVAELRGAAPLE
jgi:outer membrane biogenesis lipoprotein LolB